MKKLYGVTIPIVTPFHKDQSLDCESIAKICEWLIQEGVDCLYPCGTTGEMLRLSTEERKQIAETVVKTAAGRVPVFIQVGSMCQNDTIELAKHAHAVGADGLGVVTPEFFSATDAELIAYYKAVSASVPEDFPIYLYNIPQCAANDLKPCVVEELATSCKNIVGIKYSFMDVARTLQYLDVNGGKFSVLHGCDKIFTALLTMGCDGTVSGCAGVFLIMRKVSL